MNMGSELPERAPARDILTVGQLNRAVAGLLERSFPLLWVSGEISNLTRAASGHWYFSLKDAQASVRAVMFRGRNQHVAFSPVNGDRVEVRAQVGLYEARGDFQLNVEQMREAGAGDLYQQFLRLKARLEAEGLFDEDRKRPIPASPARIGVVTSPQAAALRDVLTTLARRAPQVPVVLYPASVQGPQAPGELIRALAAAGTRVEVDVLLLVRGGGAIEDLWAFNDEGLARAIAASPIPVICGVGHETDFTIADFVADLRAPTPTGAATRAVPDRAELLATLARERHRLVQAWRRQAEQREQRLDTATRLLRPPSLQVAQRGARVELLARRLAVVGERGLADRGTRLAAAAAGLRGPDLALRAARVDAASRALGATMRGRLDALVQRVGHAGAELDLVSPSAVLARGYAIVTGPHGAIVRSAGAVAPGDAVSVALGDGGFDARVTATAAAGKAVSDAGTD
ncbi:MAG: exodeoxyribonuclease VII large subunit [Burkholderiaceae bacterium]|jgi:exodeoxyribonuclease VII large subunit|nr:exodeoxyribonuclease VII large subunit [Burkholderiales bacterium]MCZ8338952.1 exodeoxyribonuclease VII large subunit [Burkholderiaceae bacterium]